LRQEDIKKILTDCKTIAIVGLSRDEEKESYVVGDYLQKHGFRIIPINPFADCILGEKSFTSLLDIPPELQKSLDIIDVFRKAEEVPLLVEQAVKLKKKYGNPDVFWMQLGIVNNQAAEAARKAGMTVIMDKCLMQEHRRLSK